VIQGAWKHLLDTYKIDFTRHAQNKIHINQPQKLKIGYRRLTSPDNKGRSHRRMPGDGEEPEMKGIEKSWLRHSFARERGGF